MLLPLVNLGISIVFAVFNGVMGILSHSLWYGALSTYYFVLSLLRGILAFDMFRKKRKWEDRNIGVLVGAMLIVLPLCLSFVILDMEVNGSSFEHPGLAIYAYAAYIVVKIVLAIRNFSRAYREKAIPLRALRSIDMADALTSLFALQAAMLREFLDGDPSWYNAITGAVVCGFIALIGVILIVLTLIGKKKER